MKICLDAGHSYGKNGLGKDPGAINTELRLKESVIAMDMVLLLGKMLEEKEHTIYYTRLNGSNDITLARRCRIASDVGVDLFISIHLNSSDNKDAHGIETLRYDTKNIKTIRYADNVQKRLIEATGARDRGVKIRNDLYVLKHTSMPALLIETGFISNNQEATDLNDPYYQKLICKAIVQGIEETNES